MMSSSTVAPAPADTSATALAQRIIHLHVPKTAGTSLWQAFRAAKMRMHHWTGQDTVDDVLKSDCNFITGHLGFHTAQLLGGRIITVLRNPVDHFISQYHHMRRRHETGKDKTSRSAFTARFSLEQLVQIHDEPTLNEGFLNPVTWRLAHDVSLTARRELRVAGMTDDDVLRLAVKNLSSCAAVGLQEQLDRFGTVIQEKFGIHLDIPTLNTAPKRPAAQELGIATLRRMQDWVAMDYALYDFAIKMNMTPASPDSEAARKARPGASKPKPIAVPGATSDDA